MSRLRALIGEHREHNIERRSVEALEAEIERLRNQNERLRAAMRRCTTCEYRAEALARGPDVDTERH